MLTCPRCRSEVRTAAESPYRCAGGHQFGILELLAEQSTLVSRLLGRVVRSLESTIALSGDLAATAQEEGRSFLLRYLERELEGGEKTLAFVRERLLGEIDEIEP